MDLTVDSKFYVVGGNSLCWSRRQCHQNAFTIVVIIDVGSVDLMLLKFQAKAERCITRLETLYDL